MTNGSGPDPTPFPDDVHRELFAAVRPRLAFSPDAHVQQWQRDLRASLHRALGDEPAPVPLDPKWSEEEPIRGARVRRVEFSVERGHSAVGWLLTAPSPQDPAPPTIICLQGHSTGAHVSLGRVKHAVDAAAAAEEDHDYAIQALDRGFNAFVLEQRAFGERSDNRPPDARLHFDPEHPHTDERCRHLSMVALLLGRTMIGERVFDVRRSIDLLETVDGVGTARLGIVGNSGGGTIAYYAAAVEPRISAAMPGGAVAPFAASIGAIDHCSDNYLPGAYREFDMPDLAGLIAPRPLVLVSGYEDRLVPRTGVLEAVDQIRRIYQRVGTDAAFEHYEGSGEHRFYRTAWDAFARATGW